MPRIFASILAVSLAFGGFASDAAFAAPTCLSKPVVQSAPAIIEVAAHRVRRRRGGGGDAAAAALFGAVVGGILSNPCTFGNCGYDDDYDGGYVGGGGWRGGGGHIQRGGFRRGGGGGGRGGGGHGGGGHGGGGHGRR